MNSLDLNTLLKHLAWIIALMLILQVVFYYVLEMIDYNSFLLSVILIVAVSLVLLGLFLLKLLGKLVRRK